MKFRAVLFDMDGTLLDTLRDIAESMNAVLEAKGFPAHPIDLYRIFVGDGMDTLVRRALPAENHGESMVEDCIGVMRDEYARRWDRHSAPYPGIDRMLDALVGRGIRLAILSNKPDDFTLEMSARYLGRWEFAAVAGARDGMPKKPDPAAALAIARDMDVHPGEFVYLGDTGTDMKTAVAAGMYPLGVLWGFRGAEELLASGAKRLLKEPLDLLEIIGDQGGDNT